MVHPGGEPSDFTVQSLRIGAATKLVAGGDVPDRVIQREGRRARDSNTFKIYTQGNNVDCRSVSKKLSQIGKAIPRQPGQGTVWSQTIQSGSNLGNGVGQWYAPFGVSATSEAGYIWAPVIRLRRETREVEVLVRFRYLRGRPRDDLSCQ